MFEKSGDRDSRSAAAFASSSQYSSVVFSYEGSNGGPIVGMGLVAADGNIEGETDSDGDREGETDSDGDREGETDEETEMGLENDADRETEAGDEGVGDWASM